jgi:hypothetical protein
MFLDSHISSLTDPHITSDRVPSEWSKHTILTVTVGPSFQFFSELHTDPKYQCVAAASDLSN